MPFALTEGYVQQQIHVFATMDTTVINVTPLHALVFHRTIQPCAQLVVLALISIHAYAIEL